MKNSAAITSSFDARLSNAQESSSRFKDAARNMGGILTSLGDKIRKTGVGVTLAGLTAFFANTALVTAPAHADPATQLSTQQCSDAISIATSLVERNAKKISHELGESFVQFSSNHCDLNTDWKLLTKADEQVFMEFRVHLIAMRRADAARPAVVAQR
ncbi:MAG TPA: hypothetical protein VHY35_18435 [Stellaceae bacterium]|jgi:hypothetical protein|nr:hypothetical protein [Stellaceae bacterium]